MKSFLKILLPIFCISLLTSCGGRSYETSWKESNKKYRAGKTTVVTGPWEGTWLSAANGHKGDLRCIITPVDGRKNTGTYLFSYWATWAGPLQAGFDAEFEVEKMGTQYHIQGEEDLGSFGSFKHEGVIQGKDFEASYHSSSGDHGNFVLRRPKQ